MEEEPTPPEIPSVSVVDEADYVETEEAKLIELKPVSYDLEDVADNRTDVFDKMDIDNHNVDFDQEDDRMAPENDPVDEKADSSEIDEPIQTPESTPKVNGVLKRKEKKSAESSPSATPGKSRYGRVRKPKLSTDFVSVDRKSFAVLSNTSSYEHVYADETPSKPAAKSKPRKNAKSVKVETPKPDQPSTSLTESNNAVSDTEIVPDAPKDAAKADKSSSNTPKVVKAISKTPKPTKSKAPKSPKTPKPTKPTEPTEEDPDELSVSSPTAKDTTIKTYSRKGEIVTTPNSSEDSQDDKSNEEKISQISHVELSWKVGDVAWAKIGCYSYWPSIVTLEYGSSIYVKSVGNRRLAVHVQFFGDRGRRSWVLTTSLIKYQSKEQFFDLKKQYKKDKIRFKYFLIKSNFQDLWEKAVNEADTVLKLPHEERIPYYQSLYPVVEKSPVVDTNVMRPKRPIIRRRKNPEERRGRKRKIFQESSPASASKKARDSASESSPTDAGDQKLPNSETTVVKKRQPIDDHIRKRRAFERRMNKILRHSNNNDYPPNKKSKNGLKQRGKNAKFDKLLNKENERKKQLKTGDEQAGSSSSPDSDQKKKDISVYDFESDEETDVFIGTYNSRLTPQILAKIEQEKVNEKDDSAKATSSELESESGSVKKETEDGNLSSNEIKARRLFSQTKKRPKDTDYVRPKGAASKFSKLFEHRKICKSKGKGVRGRKNIIAARRAATANKTMKRTRRGRPARAKATEQATPVVVVKNDAEEIRQMCDFAIFKEKMAQKMDAEHPEFTHEQHDEHLVKLWSELDDKEKAKYKSGYESNSDEGVVDIVAVDDDVKSSGNENDDDASKTDEKRRSSSPSSSIVPSSSKPKKLASIFTGYKADKVCQICAKPGDTVRCRGPCGGIFHSECVQKLILAKNAGLTDARPRRGRRSKKSSLKSVIESTVSIELIRGKVETLPKRGRKSVVSANASKKSSVDEFVKPVLRRSRRMGDKVKNVDDKEDQDDKDVETESNVSKEEKMETDEDPAVESAAGEEKSTVEPDIANMGEESSKEPVITNDDFKKGIKKDLEKVTKSENDKMSKEDVSTEKSNAEDEIKVDESVKGNVDDETTNKSDDLTENPVEHKKTNSNDEQVEQPDAEKEPSPEESIKSESTPDTLKEGSPTSSVADSASSSTSKNDKSSNGNDFLCHLCVEGIVYPCFACGKDEQEKTGETERVACHLSSCARVYHKECIKSWPQATWITNNAKSKNGSSSSTLKESLLCPQHYCHTCLSDNPTALKSRQGQAKLVKCIKCPTTYHQNVYCIPAGTELLNTSQIICPRHYVPPKLKSTHVNTSWCFICCVGGSLICCEECPTSFHAECLKLSPEEYEGRYICEDCQSGRYLLYGEIVWVKLGHYRWWPAQILYPQQTPENIANMPHHRGEFAVRFFGSHDYNWVNRGRAFVYQDGDSGRKTCNRTVVDLTFDKALKEAEEAYQQLKVEKASREEETKLGLKPPRYVRIKSNKPIGNVKIVELNTSNIPECRCDPNSERPCAPESDCLNRILLVECNPRVCSAGERCLNQAFEKRVYPPLEPCRTDRRGWGLKTLVDLKKGDFIIEYVGEMIDEDEYKRRVNDMYKNQEENYYFLTIDQNRMLDAGPKGNVARFMNHSCDPNCETQKWTVNGDTRIGLFALKDITANAELVFNYNLATAGNEKKPCLCGSEKCSGFIGVKAVKNGNNGNNGTDEEGRKRSNEDNGKKSLDDGKSGGNGGNNSKSSGTGRKRGRKGKRRRAPATKRPATEPAAASTLPIKKRKLSTKMAAAKPDNAIEQTKSAEDSSQSSPKPETSETENNPEEGSNQEPVTNTEESDPVEKSETEPTKPDTEEDNPTAASSPSKNHENETKKEDDAQKENENESDGDSSNIVEEVELQTSTDAAKSDVSADSDNSPSTSAGSQTKPKIRRKVQQKKRGEQGRGRKKSKISALRKRNEKLSQKRGGRKQTTLKNKKMAAAVKIKVKSVEQRVVGKRGRKPHLTEEDRELALYKSLKKRLHRKIRAMSGVLGLEEDCFMCKEKGELIFCDNKKCTKGYHIPCIKKLFKLPKGRWLCPWHYCTDCKSKCKVAKCSRCINSYCRLHIDDNIYISCEDALICKDHKSEYLADKLRVLSNTHPDLILNTSTDNDSSNFNDASSHLIDADSLLIPLRIPRPKPRPKPKPIPKPPKVIQPHILPPFIKIKQESLSDTEIEPDEKPLVKFIGESRNVARRSKLFKRSPSAQETHSSTSIDNMSIDDFIEVHHVDSFELSDDEASNNETQSNEYTDEEYEEELVEKPSDSTLNTTVESDDDYLDVEMEEIQDDSS